MAESVDLALSPSYAKEKAALPPLPKLSGYELIREKGRGPRAVVYKARRMFENDLVAVKVFHAGACDLQMQGRLETGIERTEGLQHQGLVKALGFGRDGERAFLVMEYASGEALSSFLFRHQQFPPLKTIAVILHCARALKYAATKGFHHGRLHPGVVILSRNNVRITGIGMGERAEHAEWPKGNNQSPHTFEPLIYTPPEAMPSKPEPANPTAADIYSLGAIFFHMLTCTPPFKCSDEGALEMERGALKPRHPVVWPVETFATLSPEAIELTEAMLQPDPSARPTYDAVIARCTAIQNLLQSSGAVSGDAIGESEKTVLGAPDAIAKQQQSEPKRRGGKSSAVQPVATVPLAEAQKHAGKAAESSGDHPVKKHVSHRISHEPARRSLFDTLFALMLASLTVFVALCVAYITIQPSLKPEQQFIKGLLPPENLPVARAPAAEAPLEPKQVIVAASPEEQALATRQLDKIEELLKNNQLAPSDGLAKVLRGISDRAGVASPTGIRAMIRASDIEGQVATSKSADALTPELARALTNAAEALKNVTQPPPAPVQPPAPQPVTKVEKPVEPVKAPEPAKQPEAPKPPIVAGVAAPVQNARTEMRHFGYAKAKEIVDQFNTKADTEQKRIVEDFKLTMNYEQGLFERTRSKLIDQIKKSPKHESPLQVFPRKDDPVGDDIINFDEKGLHILVRGGPNQGEKVTPWEKAPAAQVLNLLAAPALVQKNSLEDQLGIAAFAFNRGLNVEAEEALGRAQALQGGKEKADALAGIFTRIARAVEAP